MELVSYTDDDLWLTQALETDPRVMAELGGPWPIEEIPRIHSRRLDHVSRAAWYFKLVPEPGARAVGTIGIWHSEWGGEPISEAGAALRLLLERARSDGRWGDLHAFPGVPNAASNALCRKSGFELVEEADVDYGSRTLRCNHWLLRA